MTVWAIRYRGVTKSLFSSRKKAEEALEWEKKHLGFRKQEPRIVQITVH